MSDEPRDDEQGDDFADEYRDDDAGLETGETDGLGLTEEFARIEAEIETDGSEDEPEPSEPSPPPETSDDELIEPDLDPEPEHEHELVAATGDEPIAEDELGPVAEEEDEDEEQALLGGDEEEEGSQTAVHEHPVVRPMARPATRPAIPVAAAQAFSDDEIKDRTPKLWLRFLAGSILIIASMATAVSVTGLLFLSDVAAKLQPIPGIGAQLAKVDPGAPQTILIIGSDRRAGFAKEDRRSDTTMLIRVDPTKDKEVLSLFSLPRDLKVDIPGVGVGKLNEAYTAGGEKKTLKTVKAFTGIDINHVVEINFDGFADAVNAIDCVYIDVDRKYFNVNDGSAENDYADIDINSGYQRLCGDKALQYVRYRHNDTDLVRAARQQDFLREARQKVEPRELLGAIFGGGTGNELINIFTEYTRSDIDDEDDVIGILKSFAAIREVPVNEVHFEGDLGPSFVTSTNKQVEKAIDQFLNGVGSEGQRGGAAASEKQEEDKSSADKKKKKEKDPVAEASVVGTDSLTDAKFPTLADRFAADAAKNARRLDIPVFYPTVVVPGSSFGQDSRTYEYENEDNKKESGYKTVIQLTSPSTLLEYYGFMGTTWNDPPILRNPSETRKIGGREYLLFYDGGRLRLVGWKEKGNSYWLNNTLTQTIGEPEMLAMAASIKEK